MIAHNAFLVLLISSVFLSAMERSEQPLVVATFETVIKGDLYIDKWPLRYECGECNDDHKKKLKQYYALEWHPNDPIVQVTAMNEDSRDWSHRGHPILDGTFPRCLPYGLLAGKKENDILTIFAHMAPMLKNRRHMEQLEGILSSYQLEQRKQMLKNKIRIELTCKQLAADYENKYVFEQALHAVKEHFINKADWPYSCKTRLLQAGILKLDNGMIIHGPCSFTHGFTQSLKQTCINYIKNNKELFFILCKHIPYEVQQELFAEIQPTVAINLPSSPESDFITNFKNLVSKY